MSKLLIGVGVTVVIFAAVIIGYNTTQQPPRREIRVTAPISITPAELDLGDYHWGDQQSFTLTISNDGSVPATLALLETSCDCAAAELPSDEEARTLEPGETYEIELTMEMGLQAGRKTVEVTAYTIDNRRAKANVTADVNPTWTLEHEGDFFGFGQHQLGGIGQSYPTWHLVYSSKTDQLLEVVPKVPWLAIETRPLPGDGETEIVVSFEPREMSPGSLSGWFEVITDSEFVPRQSRSAYVDVVRALLPAPDPAVLAVDESATIEFKAFTGDAVRIESAEAPPDSKLDARVEDGKLVVSRNGEPPTSRPIRIEVQATDGRTGWADVIMPGTVDLVIPK